MNRNSLDNMDTEGNRININTDEELLDQNDVEKASSQRARDSKQLVVLSSGTAGANSY